MNVNVNVNAIKVDEVRAVERSLPIQGDLAQSIRPDRLSVDSSPTETVASGAVSANALRLARFKELQVAIRAGQYRPDASQLADQMLSTAAVDLRLSAMMQG